VPTPTPQPPVVTGKIRVLIVYDPLDRSLPPDKRLAFSSVVSSTAVREYLNRNCEREASGSPAFRVAPPGTDFSRDDPFWKQAASARQDSVAVPYVIIFRDGQGYVSPLPSDPASLLELLKKYGGA
jgi:hypothetical protein